MRSVALFFVCLLANIVSAQTVFDNAFQVWHKPVVADSLVNNNAVMRQNNSTADTIVPITNNLCLFSVYDAGKNSKEKLVWRMQKRDRNESLCTTRRIADLSDIQYVNYAKSSEHPKIYTYRHKEPKDSLKYVERIMLGGKTSNSLPIDTALGMQGEYIITNRLLNPKEMNIVESYLAIKYGIPLAQENNYFSAKGDRVWSARENRGYCVNVFGMGKDSLSGLVQTKSRSVADSVLSVSSEELKNGEYVLFGNNGGNLSYENNGDYYQLSREWKVQHTRGAEVVKCNLKFKIQQPTNSILRLKHTDNTTDYVASTNNYFTDVPLKNGDKLALVTTEDVEQNNSFIKISVTPNPVKANEVAKVVINTESGTTYRVALYSSEGTMLFSDEGYCEGSAEVEIHNIFGAGVYMIEAEARGVQTQEKVIFK